MMRARRALLYMPGHDMRKIQKAIALGADCACMDMEDGVAPHRKLDARQGIVEALRTLDFGRTERLVRINAVGSGLEADELAAILPLRPDGIVVPKVTGVEQVRWVSEQIAGVERAQGWPAGCVRLLLIIENARAVLDLPHIAAADERLEALIFGADDFAIHVGATRTRAGWEVFYARSAVLTCAAAFGLQAIDIVYVDFSDIQGVRQEAVQGAQMGFAGKQIIHPNQLEPVQAAFTPDDEAIAYAVRIVQAYAAHQASGLGAFALDGKMVDTPIVKMAEHVLARARAAGKAV